MINYQDYFEETMYGEFYYSEEEYQKDCFAWLDMCLGGLIERKGGVDASFPEPAGGLPITHEEMRRLLDKTPPDEQVQEQIYKTNEEIQQELVKAYQHIQSRQQCSVECGAIHNFMKLQERFSTSLVEFFCIIVAAAPNFDRKYERIYAYLQDNIAATVPTLGLAVTALSQVCEVSEEAIAGLCDRNSVLNRFCFEYREADSFLMKPLLLKHQIVLYLHGYHTMSEKLEGYVKLLWDDDLGEELAPMVIGQEKKQQLTQFLDNYIGQEHPEPGVVIQLAGPVGSGRRFLLCHVSRDSDIAVLFVNVKKLLQLSEQERREKLDELISEVLLTNGWICLNEMEHPDDFSGSLCKEIIDYLMQWIGVIFLCTAPEENKIPLSDYQVLLIHFETPKASDRIALWEAFGKKYSFAEDVSLEEFANQYTLTPGATKTVLKNAWIEQLSLGVETITKESLQRAVAHSGTLDFKGLAKKINAVYHWEDIDLEKRQIERLKLACSRLKLRYKVGEQWGLDRKNAYGRGISILLYGPPGTGKTMTAQVVANEMGMELYRVDISQIVSKYIGETEKNLSLIFDEAKKSNVILFFDEADSLFTKRTEVKSSNDKHANSETSYILQKVEEYDGITILATNLFNNFDDAFVRRITYMVRFDNPDVEARYRLWTSILPKEVPIAEDIDFHMLAESFQLSGSNIKAILYSAAYMAASEDTVIEARHLVRAIKYELTKNGRILSGADFGSYGIYYEE